MRGKRLRCWLKRVARVRSWQKYFHESISATLIFSPRLSLLTKDYLQWIFPPPRQKNTILVILGISERWNLSTRIRGKHIAFAILEMHFHLHLMLTFFEGAIWYIFLMKANEDSSKILTSWEIKIIIFIRMIHGVSKYWNRWRKEWHKETQEQR